MTVLYVARLPSKVSQEPVQGQAMAEVQPLRYHCVHGLC